MATASVHVSAGSGCAGSLANYERREEWEKEQYDQRNKNELNNYDYTRRELNFTVTRDEAGNAVAVQVSATNNTKENFDRRLAELNFKSYYEGATNQPNNCVSAIISGDHELLTKLAYGDQNISFEKNADNSHIRRLSGIEQWACDSYDWACNRWGEQNIVGFQVHMDEKTPHIHLTFIPVAEKKQRGRVKPGTERKTKPVVSYKGVFGETKGQRAKYLEDMHTDYHRQVGSKYGLDRGRHKSELTPEELRERKHKSKAVLTAENEAKANLSSLLSESKDLSAQIAEQKDRLSVLGQTKSIGEKAFDLASDLIHSKTKRKYEEETKKAVEREKELKNAINKLSEVRQWKEIETQSAAKMKKTYAALIETNRAKIDGYDQMNRKIQDIKATVEEREKCIEKFVTYGVVYKEDWAALFSGKAVPSTEIRVRGQVIPLASPIHLRLNKDKELFIHDRGWTTESTFWDRVRKGLTDAFKVGSQLYHSVLELLGFSQQKISENTEQNVSRGMRR